MTVFLVSSRDEPLRPGEAYLVSAASPEEALEKYVRQVYMPSSLFRDWVRDTAPNGGFAERFYLASAQEVERLTRCGEYGTEPEVVRSRVAWFFQERPDLGQAYADYLETENSQLLSEELFEFIALHQDPASELGIQAIELSSLSILD